MEVKPDIHANGRLPLSNLLGSATATDVRFVDEMGMGYGKNQDKEICPI